MRYEKLKAIERELATLSGVPVNVFLKITTISDFLVLARMRGLI